MGVSSNTVTLAITCPATALLTLEAVECVTSEAQRLAGVHRRESDTAQGVLAVGHRL
jgi:hypothetical protein